MKLLSPAIALLAILTVSSAADEAPLGPPPAELVQRLNLSPTYKKYLDAHGIPVLGSEKVTDYAIREAAYLIDHELGDRDDVRKAIIESKVRLAVMAYNEMTTSVPEHHDLTPAKYWDRRARGLGASPDRPAVSCAEENLLCYPGDHYAAENILIHEFAHVIHQQGLAKVDPAFNDKLQKCYHDALAKGLWKNTYAASNSAEYWAEVVQSWFDTNRRNDDQHNDIDTRDKLKKYDPDVAALIEASLGDNPWRYQRPAARPESERAHLAGFDASKAPRFEWPKDLVEWYDRHVKRPGADQPDFVALELEPAGKDIAASPQSSDDTTITFVNQRASAVTLYWLDFDGKKKSYGTVAPGAEHKQSTFSGHQWIIADDKDESLGLITAQAVDGKAVIK